MSRLTFEETAKWLLERPACRERGPAERDPDVCEAGLSEEAMLSFLPARARTNVWWKRG